MESANNGVHGSPAYEIWGDSKWAEFYIYDLYTALGIDREAQGRLPPVQPEQHAADDFPRRGTRWFRDWSTRYGGTRAGRGHEQVLRGWRGTSRERLRRDLQRRMNWGEYVHFTSGAAAADMSGQAARVSAGRASWADQLRCP